MALVDAKINEKANRRFRRLKKKERMNLQKAISQVVGTYNIIGQTSGFKVECIYQVTWLVGGRAVGNTMLTIPMEECTGRTPDDWFKEYVETMMFAFDLEHADVMVSEVINDVKSMHTMRSDETTG